MRPRTHGATGRLLPALVAGALSLALYAVTLAPGIWWGDSAQLQIAAAHPRAGVGARSYTAWTFLASLGPRLASVSPARSANLTSALFGALAVALCYSFTRRISGSALGASLAAGSLAVAHAFWSASVVAEVYTATALLLLLLLPAATSALRDPRRPALLFGLVTGLSLLHHRMVLVTAFSIFLVLAGTWLRRGTLRAGVIRVTVGFLAGSVPFLVLALASPLPGGLEAVFLGGFRLSLPGGGLPGLLLYEGRFLGLDLAGPQLVLAAAGAVLIIRRRLESAGPLLACLAVGLVLPLFFGSVGDRSLFLLPALTAACVLAGLGATLIPGRSRSFLPALVLLAATLLAPAGTYAVLARYGAAHPEKLLPGASPAHVRAVLWPGKAGDRDADRFGRRVLAALPPDARLLTGWGDGEVIRYLREVEGLRLDVRAIRRHPRHDLRLALRRHSPRPLFVSEYPGLPLRLSVPPGVRLREIVPRSLWRVVRAP